MTDPIIFISRNRIKKGMIEIYGTPSTFSMEMMKKVAGSGIDVSVNPRFIGGFIRLKSG